MKVGVILLNFGEPEEATREKVVPFLERIFFANANLEDLPDPEARRHRSRELAERRAPGLIEEYESMGPSPLIPQADAQARALGDELESRDFSARVYSAFQFTNPLVAEVVGEARNDGVEWLIGLPVYPLCGPSTNVAALDAIQSALDEMEWAVPFQGITGWHRHPQYLRIRADSILRTAEENGVRLDGPDSRLIFSAHGTPKKYLDEGSRYVEYVEEFCADIGRTLEVNNYLIGYQNHSNRGIEWTQPDVDEVIRTVEAKRVIVDPVSFMHEQSETLAELDGDLREEAEELGLDFHRVPVPHDDARFAGVLADLVESVTSAGQRPSALHLDQCRCRPAKGTVCLNSTERSVAVQPPGVSNS